MLKSLLAGCVLLLFSVMVASLAPRLFAEKEPAAPPAQMESYDKFNAAGLKFTEYAPDDAVIRLSAGKVVHRKRKSKMFEYQNLKELYLQDAVLELHLAKHHVLESGYSSPFTILHKYGQSLPGVPTVQSIESSVEKYSDMEMDVLSRVLFERFSLRICYPSGLSLAISSDHAFVNADLGGLMLAGNVVVNPPIGERIRASEAVLSPKANGVFFPSGHFRNEEFVQGKAFYRVAVAGSLVRSPSVPGLRYVDLIQEKEDEFYGRMAQRIPLQVRVMLGMTEGMMDGTPVKR